MTLPMQNTVKLSINVYFTTPILCLRSCTKSKNRLARSAVTLIVVALGHPYYPEHVMGITSGEYWYGRGNRMSIFMKTRKNIMKDITRV